MGNLNSNTFKRKLHKLCYYCKLTVHHKTWSLKIMLHVLTWLVSHTIPTSPNYSTKITLEHLFLFRGEHLSELSFVLSSTPSRNLNVSKEYHSFTKPMHVTGKRIRGYIQEYHEVEEYYSTQECMQDWGVWFCNTCSTGEKCVQYLHAMLVAMIQQRPRVQRQTLLN